MKIYTRRVDASFAAAIAAAITAAAVSVSSASQAATLTRDSDAANDVVIRNVRIFDGTRTLQNAQVLVIDGRIVAMGANVKVPQGVAQIDGRGKTLLPGFIDAHTHSYGDAQRDALRFGVTTELDMMGDTKRLPSLKTQRASMARSDEADVWSAGAAVTAPKGHGTQFGMSVPTLAADGDTAAFVQARVDEGSDYIKIIVEEFQRTQRHSTLADDHASTSAAGDRRGAKRERARGRACVAAARREIRGGE